MAVLAKAASGSYNVFVVGGYMGSGINTGKVEKTGVKLYTWLDKTSSGYSALCLVPSFIVKMRSP